MKYFSKVNNLRIVLRHGVPGNPVLGEAAKPGIHVRFEDGMAKVEDPEMIRMMDNHPGFNSDFIKVEDIDEQQSANIKDPYGDIRKDSEPQHQMSELAHGSVASTTKTKVKVQLTPEMREALAETAKKMAMEMAPQMAMEMLKTMAKEGSKKPATKKVAKKSTSKKAQPKVEEPVEETTEDSTNE